MKQVEMGFGSMLRVARTGECHARRKTRPAVCVARSNYGIMGSDDVPPSASRNCSEESDCSVATIQQLDHQALKQHFDEQGFVHLRGFLSAEMLAELELQLDRYITDVVPGLPRADAFFVDRARPETLKQLQKMEQDSYFAEYRNHPRWVELAETVLGEPASAIAPEWFNKPPGTDHPTPPHQDNYYLCFEPPQVVTLWLALDHVDNENGCLRYLPGSQLDDLRPHAATEVIGFSQGITDYSDEERARETVLELEPGDLVAHHGTLIHRAEPNRSSDRQRRAFAMVFRADSCSKNETRLALYQSQLKNQHGRLNGDS